MLYREGNRSRPSLQTFYLSNAEGKLAAELSAGLKPSDTPIVIYAGTGAVCS